MSKSMTLSAAAAILAYCGSVSALPGASGSSAYSYPNATISVIPSGSSGLPIGTSTAQPDQFCPQLNGKTTKDGLNVEYSIACNQNAIGVLLNYNAAGYTTQKRATGPTSLSDCLTTCSTLGDACVAASFNTNTEQCELFSAITGTTAAAGVEFAKKVPSASTSSSAMASTGFPSYPTGNGTGMYPSGTMPGATGVRPTNTTSAPTATATVDLFCPYLDEQAYADRNGRSYMIECNRNHVGTIIRTENALQKRQAVVQNPSLENCLTGCDAIAGCVATAFDTNAETCTYFSEIGGAYYSEGIDFAFVLPGDDAAATTGAAASSATITEFATQTQTITRCAPGVACPADSTTVITTAVPIATTVVPYTTSTVYRTEVETITSCAATVTDCPARAGQPATVTSVVVDYTTVCPATAAGTGAVTANPVQGSGVVSGAAGPMTTSTVYTTSLRTITSCAATVTDCPARNGPATVTDVVALYTTVCPVSGASTANAVTAVPTPVACSGCPYAQVTVNVFSASVATVTQMNTVYTTTSMCPAGSTVVNYPVPTAPAAQTTILSTVSAPASTYVTAVSTELLTSNIVTATSTPAAATTPAGSSGAAQCSGGASCPAASTTGVQAFTGAASGLKAGMGFAAMIVAAAFML
ncbi:hypothetical protein H2203_008320 [Taxawa tesnikishii (nom. ined.)]|nr:hypothetical protein H2203_008320 [Dothideales sp. JES 119]